MLSSEHKDASYKQEFVLRYGGSVVYETTKVIYKKEIEDQLSDVEKDLQGQCISAMGTKAPRVLLTRTVKCVLTTGTVIRLFSC